MALVVFEIKFYELLKAKIGERKTEAFMQIIETKVDNKLEEKTPVFSTKEDVATLEGKRTTQIAEVKVDIIKWMLGTATALLGLLFAVMLKLH